MTNLTATADIKALDHLNLVTSWTPTSPLKLALLTVNGSASAAGTEVTGGSYARQTATLAASSGTPAVGANSNTIVFTMPACTIVGAEIYDSAGSPVRMWFGALTSRTFLSGDTYTINPGQLTTSLG